MKDACYISSYVVLKDRAVIRDGVVLYENKNSAGADFLDRVYEHFEINYPRFHKMDHLCKTGFLASEILLQDKNWKEQVAPEERGVILSNSHSSLDTDIRYEDSIAQSPSPSLFVYTLPNVLIGEICIRHQAKGETACFVFDIFDARFQAGYVNTLFETEKVKSCLSGWADYYNEKAEAFSYLAEQTKRSDSLLHEPETLEKIYHS